MPISTYEHSKQRKTNSWLILLILFPASLFLALFFPFLLFRLTSPYASLSQIYIKTFIETVTIFLPLWLFMSFVVLWCYFFNRSAIQSLTGAKSINPNESLENKELFRLLENICISAGLKRIPSLCVIEDSALNAFAMGNRFSSSVVLTSGLIASLNKSELEGVIAHEVAHIINNDVELLSTIAISLMFLEQMAYIFLRSELRSSLRKSRFDKKGVDLKIIKVAVSLIAYGFIKIIAPILFFMLSKEREYLADATGAQLTRNPLALASALHKISGNVTLSRGRDLRSVDYASIMYIHTLPFSGGLLRGLFSTHPPIQKRIEALNVMAGKPFNYLEF